MNMKLAIKFQVPNNDTHEQIQVLQTRRAKDRIHEFLKIIYVFQEDYALQVHIMTSKLHGDNTHDVHNFARRTALSKRYVLEDLSDRCRSLRFSPSKKRMLLLPFPRSVPLDGSNNIRKKCSPPPPHV